MATTAPTFLQKPVDPARSNSGRSGPSALSRFARRTVFIIGGIVAVALIYTAVKAMGHATGGTWPFTSMPLPFSTDDVTMPPVMDIVLRFGQPQRTGDPKNLTMWILEAMLFTFREAFVGFIIGIIIGMAIALIMLRTRWLERGVMPWVIVSQTVPLIALAPVVVAFGNQIKVPLFSWQQWMSVALIATYLTFFPVAVNGLRGLKSPTPLALDFMRTNAASGNATLWKLRMPAAVPYLIPALKLAATASVVGAIVGEISAGVRGGLGRLLIDYSAQYLSDPSRLYCVVIGAALLGVLFVALINVTDLLLMRNRPREAR